MVCSLRERLVAGVASDPTGASTRSITDPAASMMTTCDVTRPLEADSWRMATSCPSGDGSMDRILESPGAAKT
jgi:hypothetical protein